MLSAATSHLQAPTWVSPDPRSSERWRPPLSSLLGPNSPLSARPDEYLLTAAQLDRALLSLLDSPLFASHGDRMTANLVACISPAATPSMLFITLMLLLHLGVANPLVSSMKLAHALPGGAHASSKVFKALRKSWATVVPVLMDCVMQATTLDEGHATRMVEQSPEAEAGRRIRVNRIEMDAWAERLGTPATVVLYEVCRVQRLSPAELCRSILFALPSGGTR